MVQVKSCRLPRLDAGSKSNLLIGRSSPLWSLARQLRTGEHSTGRQRLADGPHFLPVLRVLFLVLFSS